MPVYLFKNADKYFLAQARNPLSSSDIEKLSWLLNAAPLKDSMLQGRFVGPRKEMVTPWSTNAVEISQNTGIEGVIRIEAFHDACDPAEVDPMLQQAYETLGESTLVIDRQPQPILTIKDIAVYNQEMGLALSEDEIAYLNQAAAERGRPFTDSEIFGFAQINSEHCRHKIFNGSYVLDGSEMPDSLFGMIKNTTKANPNNVLNRYNDNVAFFEGEACEEFAPESPEKPSPFKLKTIDAIASIKAETHNFPTTVEPFNGAATGSGGEIRDRMAGGRGSLPLAGTACYMTSYPRLKNHPWEKSIPARPWLYQTPQEILTKASNGASDFGNKFGQPLINGSLLTFEYKNGQASYGYDKTIMLAGGVGTANKRDTLKNKPAAGDKIILLGGDNYRIGMGGGAVSSMNTGTSGQQTELNAVQRSNPEMQKRVFNCIRGILEQAENSIVLIHDHGAGGHINCLSELVEDRGGRIDMRQLPVGDPSLSDKEIIGNESQERMGLVVKEEDVPLLRQIAERERAPMYVIGTVTDDGQFIFENSSGQRPVDITLDFLFGKPPKTTIDADTLPRSFSSVPCVASEFEEDLNSVLSLEAVACKDWLTNKVDRSVTGRVVQQQCVGPYQLPLHGAGVMALSYTSLSGIVTAMGHNPAAMLADPVKGAVLSIAESLTNLMFVPIKGGLSAITLSANWMWPFKAKGEPARIFQAVKAVSDFSIALGTNVSTGKDSMSMIQKYPNGEEVLSPGTVIISAAGICSNNLGIVTPDIKRTENTVLVYLDLSGIKDCPLGGSSWSQTKSVIGQNIPTIQDPALFVMGFSLVQKYLARGKILSGQDISSGGLVTAALEMAFTAGCGLSLEIKTDASPDDTAAFLFCEKPGALIQMAASDAEAFAAEADQSRLICFPVGSPVFNNEDVSITAGDFKYADTLSELRSVWFHPSYLLEKFQTSREEADRKWSNFDQQTLRFSFPEGFSGKAPVVKSGPRVKAAIIREKGTNGEREMAFSMYAAGFEVRDVTMTDLTSGRETLEDLNFIVFCGGFSNSDVLGSARGWAGVFKYNETAMTALKNFYARPDTLSLGVCNGCQLMVLLGLIHPENPQSISMAHNRSGKFESAFLSVEIPQNNAAIMFKGMEKSRLGIWVAHGEGRFSLPAAEADYDIALKYSWDEYPGNPNGSDHNAAGIVSKDGRHLAMMPHLERAVFPWQWAYYPEPKSAHETAPWLQAFVNAREWIETVQS